MLSAVDALPALYGALIGLVLAVTGAGGGVLAVPLLVFGLQLPLPQAAPVALMAVGAAAAFGAVLGLREGIVRYRAAALIGSLAMAMAPLGVWLAHRLPPQPLAIGFALVLGWTAWRMAGLRRRDGPEHGRPARRPPCRLDPADGRLRWTAPCAWALGATGAVAGLLTGLLGVGGGFVIVPALTRSTDVDARGVAATSLAVIALATLSGIVAASGHGSLDWALAARFGGGAVLGLGLGRLVARRLPATAFQRAFAGLSAVVALGMLVRGLGGLGG